MRIIHSLPSPDDTKNGLKEAALLELGHSGLRQRYGFDPAKPQTEREREIARRLGREVESIAQSGRVNQFLMLRDIVRYAAESDVSVSPGCGRFAGSFLAYALGITKIDPYGHGLMYAVPLQVIPVIDVSADGCEQVVRYVKANYWDADSCRSVELFEFPVLDTVQKVLQRIRRVRGESVDLDAIPLDDAETFDLLRRGDTEGVYQLDTEASQRRLREWMPTSFDDLVVLTACSRPGLEQLIPLMVARRSGSASATLCPPELEPITASTYGFILYHDQVVEAAHVFAGYPCERGDRLRRLLKRTDTDAKRVERPEFVKACGMTSGLSSGHADEIFQVLEKLAGYTYSKAHAVAHGVLTFQMAYLKAHYPLAFAV